MRKALLLLTVSLITYHSHAQWQLGISGGIANYQGDITNKLYRSPGAAVGLSLGYQVSPRLNLRASLMFAKVKGADSLNSDPYLVNRNLSFQTPVTEFSIAGELHAFDLEVKRWSPYVFGGIGVYRFNPYTFDQAGIKTYLQPLGTEGQGIPGYAANTYTRTQFAIPFGGGIKYNISDNVRIGLEVGLRKLFTDYLDDVSGNYADESDLLAFRGERAAELAYRGDEIATGNPIYPPKSETRGSPKYKDYYYFSTLNITFLLPEGRGSGRAARRGGYGCPVF